MPPRKSRAPAVASQNVESDVEMDDAPPNGDSSHAAIEEKEEEDPTVQQDAEPVQAEEEFMIGDEDPNVLKIRILPGESDSAASYEFLNEDHTLGNALRYIIMKNPDVEFCGYSIPHPSDPKMNIRIQTFNDSTATAHQILEKGLDDLMDLCDVVLDKFQAAVGEHAR